MTAATTINSVRLGQLLCRLGLIDARQIGAALNQQRAGSQLLGQILLQQSRVKPAHLQLVLCWQRWLRLSALVVSLLLGFMQEACADESKGLLQKSTASSASLTSLIAQSRYQWGAPVATAASNALAYSVKTVENTSKKIYSVAREQLKNSFKNVCMGEFEAGVGRHDYGKRFQAVWSSKYVLMEMKYQF
jgi:hypothetical protein